MNMRPSLAFLTCAALAWMFAANVVLAAPAADAAVTPAADAAASPAPSPVAADAASSAQEALPAAEAMAPPPANAAAPVAAVAFRNADEDEDEDDDTPTLRVSAPFLELTAGPGRGYPALHALEQGDRVTVLKRKTDWFKLEAENGDSGWVHRDVVLRSVQGAGYVSPTLDDYGAHRFELGMMSGDFDGAATIGVFGAYALSPNLSLKLGGQKILGNVSDGWIAAADIVVQPFADWRIAPYFTLGGGAVHVEPQTTLIASQDRTDEMAHVGVGLRFYLARRFVLRAEYESYQVFTERNENEEIEQWQVGVSAFF